MSLSECLGPRDAFSGPGARLVTERTAMPTTALVVQVAEHTAMLCDSSCRHAGENLQGLLDQRQAGLDRLRSREWATKVRADAARHHGGIYGGIYGRKMASSGR
jgi:hypothetical protein